MTVLASAVPCPGQFDIEGDPIRYSKTEDANSVTDLIARIESGDTRLEYKPGFGYLASLLESLDISDSSQGLVFSKTSLQVAYISKRNPRAIYFNDDVYVGWVRGSPLLEISTSDPQLGAAFYSAENKPAGLEIRRRNYTCLACHATTLTRGVPGHTVRSVFVKHDGGFDYRRESFITDHRSPFSKRWGGWYVTGGHAAVAHMGNVVFSGSQPTSRLDEVLPDLRDHLPTADWLTPYSDIVALMVLEHQTQMHNTLTLANFRVRHAIHDSRQTDRGDGTDEQEALSLVIDTAAREIADYLLFREETPLNSELVPSGRFVKEFSAREPSDGNGRSLRQFNLKTRLFEYPCSYMIYSRAFESIEPRLRLQVYRCLWGTLNTDAAADDFPHLSNESRHAIREIIRATKDDLPDFWTDTAAELED